MNCVLIPARGGSKSIKKKNIVDLGGYPMIYYTIRSALGLSSIDRVIVSTDDQEIAEISKFYGAEVPFIRPDDYSKDNSSDYDVVNHFLKWTEESSEAHIDTIIYLRPDFPFRQTSILMDAIDLYNSNLEADGLRSVQASKETPYKTWGMENNYLVPLLDYNGISDIHNAARQLLPKTFWPNGYIEIYDTKNTLEQRCLRGKKIIPFMVDSEVVNVGSYEELEYAKKKVIEYTFT